MSTSTKPAFRRLLQWARIEDEHGQLSLTTIAFGVGCACLLAGQQVSLAELSAFALGLSTYQAKRYLAHRRAQKAMDTAHAHSLKQLELDHGAGVKVLATKVDEMQRRVLELATPERLDALRSMVKR